MTVGLIGLGRMGGAMAANLRARGHRLFVHDVRPEACAAVAGEAVEVCDGPAEVSRPADVVLTSLPGPSEVEAVMLGDRGVLAGARPGTVVADTSTVGPAQSRRLASEFAARGVAYLDAPVSGGIPRARAGTLLIMVGGDAGAFERARPVLESIGSDLHHVGESGAGNNAKLLIQMIFFGYMSLFCKGLALGERLSIPFETLFQILAASSAGQPRVETRYEAFKANDLTPRFEVNGALKDLALVRELVAPERLPLLEAVIQEFERARSLGWGDKDITAVRGLLQPPTP